nr:MAG TPA: hypothetical protein [Bacteriophage sp.]
MAYISFRVKSLIPVTFRESVASEIPILAAICVRVNPFSMTFALNNLLLNIGFPPFLRFRKSILPLSFFAVNTFTQFYILFSFHSLA